MNRGRRIQAPAEGCAGAENASEIKFPRSPQNSGTAFPMRRPPLPRLPATVLRRDCSGLAQSPFAGERGIPSSRAVSAARRQRPWPASIGSLRVARTLAALLRSCRNPFSPAAIAFFLRRTRVLSAEMRHSFGRTAASQKIRPPFSSDPYDATTFIRPKSDGGRKKRNWA